MLNNKLYSIKVLNSLIEQKVLNHNSSKKFYIRSNLLNSTKSHFLIDNNSEFSILNQTKESINDLCMGKAVLMESLSLKSVLVNFKVNNYFNNCLSSSFLSSFEQSLYGLSLSKSLALIIISPKKGGFICYSNGITGFLPKSHLHYSFKKLKLFLTFCTKRKKLRKFVLPLINVLLDKTDLFLKQLRIPGFIGKTILYPRYKRRIKKRLKRKFLNKKPSSFNFVFLTKKKDLIKASKNKNYVN